MAAPTWAAQPTVTGGGQSPYGTFSFSAELLPTGEAQGHMTLVMAPNLAFGELFEAQVVCVGVLGNTATIVGQLTKTLAAPEIQFLIFRVQDNGQPGDLVPDLFDALISPRFDPPDCLPLQPGTPTQSGNITVGEPNQ
jgi:hypothetical protein